MNRGFELELDERDPLQRHIAAEREYEPEVSWIYPYLLRTGDAFVDGGAHSPTNADLLADHDFDLVVVSSPMSVAGNRLRPSLDLPARRLCRFYLGQEAARIRRRGVPVIAFQPTGDDLKVMGMNAMDPARRGPVTKQARESTLKKLERDDVQSVLGSVKAGMQT